MERTWMILARVIRVPPDEAQAQPEQAAVGEADQAAQAQAQAEQAALEQADQGAGGQAEQVAQQAEQPAQAQHAAAVEAEVAAARAVLEDLVVEVDQFKADEAAAANNLGEPGFTVSVAPPARVTFLTARPNSHPDRHPYIIATGSFCLLAHFATGRYYGTDFRLNFAERGARERDHHHLIVARHFRRAGGEIAASAVRVPARPDDVPALRNVESVGFVCDGYNKRRSYNYTIAELVVDTGRPEPELELVIFRSNRGYWRRVSGLESPLVANRRWVPHGAVAVGSTVMWFDLSWGILGCNVEQRVPEHFEFSFYRLPPGRVLEEGHATEHIHNRRCIAVSGDLLRYVEIIVPDANPNPNDGAATVSMWSLLRGGQEWRWIANYRVAIQDIWSNESYARTGLPQTTPVLAGVSPANPDVVYFDLNHRLFAVNVPACRVVGYEANQHELVNVPGSWAPQSQTGSSRYLVAWNLQRPGKNRVIIGHVSPDLQVDEDDEPEDPKGKGKGKAKGKGKSKATDGRRKSTSASSRTNKSIRIK